MKRVAAIVLFVLAGLGAVNRAGAQDHEIRVTIPFDFTFGRTLLPAGEYTITSRDQIAVVIDNRSQSATALRSALAEDDHTGVEKLIFTKYGDQYFLREILCPKAHLNLRLPASNLEKKAKLQLASVEEAPQVYIALNQ